MEEGWWSQWILRFELTANWYILTTSFHILTVWNGVLPGAVLCDSQQLVDVTFSSYFKSSFHSKMKMLLLAVTFRCVWLCHTVKKWKFHLHRLVVISTVAETEYSVGWHRYICVSICQKDFSHFNKNETSHLPPLMVQSVCCLHLHITRTCCNMKCQFETSWWSSQPWLWLN